MKSKPPGYAAGWTAAMQSVREALDTLQMPASQHESSRRRNATKRTRAPRRAADQVRKGSR